MQQVKVLLKRVGIAMLIATLCRVLFFLLNYSSFEEISTSLFFYGLRFDVSVVAILYSPFLLLSVVPFIKQKAKTLQQLQWFFFHAANTLCIMLNAIDFEYYKFTLKRSTADLFTLATQGDDLQNLLPAFFTDYWYVVLSAALLVAFSLFLYKKTSPSTYGKPAIKVQLVVFFVSLLLIFTAARGGYQARPINVLQAGEYTTAENVPLVINTPFAILQSFEQEKLKIPNYFTIEEAQKIYQPFASLQSEHPFDKKNVVIIIMESLNKEYVGFYHKYGGYTPFLDSLMQHSIVFSNCFANGKKSVEALPSIFCGTPALMDAPYVFSPYVNNRLNSMPTLLKKHGYTSSFFHGGNNGTMAFDSFTKTAGFDNYYGRNEYDNDADYDGNWGIFDEPFFQFVASMLSESKQPFMAGLMSLSTHHPYTIPEKHKGKFKPGKHKIHPTVQYADYALKEFFATVKKQPWYNNTLFVITADHTAQRFEPLYRKTRTGMYAVPLVMFSPENDTAFTCTNITQHADILPTVLAQLHYSGNFVCFGQDALGAKNGFAINYINHNYQYVKGNYALHFDGEQTKKLYNFYTDSLQQHNIIKHEPELVEQMETELKAMIQQYNWRMVHNKLLAE